MESKKRKCLSSFKGGERKREKESELKGERGQRRFKRTGQPGRRVNPRPRVHIQQLQTVRLWNINLQHYRLREDATPFPKLTAENWHTRVLPSPSLSIYIYIYISNSNPSDLLSMIDLDSSLLIPLRFFKRTIENSIYWKVMLCWQRIRISLSLLCTSFQKRK